MDTKTRQERIQSRLLHLAKTMYFYTVDKSRLADYRDFFKRYKNLSVPCFISNDHRGMWGIMGEIRDDKFYYLDGRMENTVQNLDDFDNKWSIMFPPFTDGYFSYCEWRLTKTQKLKSPLIDELELPFSSFSLYVLNLLYAYKRKIRATEDKVPFKDFMEVYQLIRGSFPVLFDDRIAYVYKPKFIGFSDKFVEKLDHICLVSQNLFYLKPSTFKQLKPFFNVNFQQLKGKEKLVGLRVENGRLTNGYYNLPNTIFAWSCIIIDNGIKQ